MKKHQESFPDAHHDAGSNTLFGFWIYLMTDAIMFSTLFATYAVLRNNTAGGPSAGDLFHLPSVLAETLLLLMSVFTFSLARLAIEEKNLRKTMAWLAATFLLGALFTGKVGVELSNLAAQGYGWQRSGFLSAYFTLAVTHMLHMVGGLLFMIVLGAQNLAWGFSQRVVCRWICLQMFWGFSYLLWLFMFAIVYLIGST